MASICRNRVVGSGRVTVDGTPINTAAGSIQIEFGGLEGETVRGDNADGTVFSSKSPEIVFQVLINEDMLAVVQSLTSDNNRCGHTVTVELDIGPTVIMTAASQNRTLSLTAADGGKPELAFSSNNPLETLYQ